VPTSTRPRLHFTAREGWINDPLGLTWHDCQYHLFFQYVPGQTTWGPDQRWGHATSADLLHWTEGPVALEPGDGDDGVWSGSIVVPPDGPACLFYTTVTFPDVQIGKARLARPVDDTWTTWVKQDVVAQLPPDLDVIAFRDPYVFHDGGCWRMLMGAGLADGSATALTYRSNDLTAWEYSGQLAVRHRSETEPLWTGAVWECPQLFRLGGRWVLTVSVWEPEVPHYEAYAIGDLVDGQFVAEHWGRLSYGPSYYAASAFRDRDGERGLIYWLRDVDDVAGRWAGAHSVPHRLRLETTRVVAEPHPAVRAARGPNPTTATSGSFPVPAAVDVEWELDTANAVARLTVASDSVDQLQLAIADGQLTAEAAGRSWTMPVSGTSVRVLLDGPVVEVFSAACAMALPIDSMTSGRTLTIAGDARVSAFPLT
jgi:beta-fructofuranosidase